MYFGSIYITDVLWNNIQGILGPLWFSLLLLNIDTLLTSFVIFLFGFHAHSPFFETLVDLAEILEGWNNLECCYDVATDTKENYCSMVGHCHP